MRTAENNENKPSTKKTEGEERTASAYATFCPSSGYRIVLTSQQPNRHGLDYAMEEDNRKAFEIRERSISLGMGMATSLWIFLLGIWAKRASGLFK